MALMKMECGACGANLSPDDSVCPQCGVAVEMPEGKKGKKEPSGLECPSCGHRNVNVGRFCESCGTRLEGGSKDTPPPEKKARKSRVDRKEHTPIMVMVVLFVGWMLYDEYSREFPGPVEAQAHNHPEETAVDESELTRINELRQAVEANPEDDGSLLKLANLLQDYSSHDSRFLVSAVETYKKYLDRNPSEGNPRVDLGICYFELSKLDSALAEPLLKMAIGEMETVFAANPSHQAAAYNLGIVNLNMGRTIASNEWFQRAAQIDPQTNLGQRAQQLLEQHSFDEL